MQKKNLKATNNEKEKELKQVINGMKGQIDKLFQIIKMIYNTIVYDDDLRKNVVDQLEEIK